MKPSGNMKKTYSFAVARIASLLSGSEQDVTFNGIENEYRSDVENRRARRAEFEKRFQRVDRIPLVGRIGKGLFAEGGLNIALLFAILIVFTAMKAPYFGLPFTGDHATKYNTYVEPALYMSQTNNPLLYMKKYVADPVTNPGGIFKTFDHLPIFEWGLFLTYKVLPFGSIETKTRLFTHFIGLGMLVFAYLFFIRWLPAKLTLLVLAMMSINPIILFGTYVTVLDSLALFCMFFSFAMLSKYFEGRDPAHLFWAGMIFGIGISIKYSLLLWMAPISLLLVYWESEDAVAFLRDILVYALLGILVILVFKTSIGTMIASPMMSSLILVAWTGFCWALFRILRRGQPRILRWIAYVYGKKIYLSIGIIAIMLVCFRVFSFFKFGTYGEDFLTDATIGFDLHLYKYMLLHQFKDYMTRTVFWLGMCGFALVLGFGNTRSRRVVAAFLAGSVAYWIIASKAMFFHNYYTLIIMILFSLSASFIIYYLYRNMPSVGAKMTLVFLLCTLILPPIQDATAARLGRYDPVDDVVEFIRQNTAENDFILYEGGLAPLVIYTGRGFVTPATLVSDEIREEIQRLGFAETMRKYRIKYFFSPYEKPFYKDFAPLFANTKLLELGGWGTRNRNILILEAIGRSPREPGEDMKEIEQVEKKYDIPGKFKPVVSIGNYHFYSFLN